MFWRRTRKTEVEQLPEVGPYWPALDADYRYGFPISKFLIDELEAMPEATRVELLKELESAAFQALVTQDLSQLP